MDRWLEEWTDELMANWKDERTNQSEEGNLWWTGWIR